MFPRSSLRLALLALLTLPVAACDSEAMTDLRRNIGMEGAEQEPQAPEGPRPPAVSPLVEPIETGAAAPRPIPTVEPVTYRSTAFVAGSNEPFWNVQISGNTATYRTAPDEAGREIQVNRLTFATGVEYVGVLDGRPFVVNLRAIPCRDGAPRERFRLPSRDRSPLTARLTVGGQTIGGCGAPAEPAPAPAAPAADAEVTAQAS
ncbi:MAG: hypothetical protein FJX25_03525 [Alphaproteobacteria bacterium]|nr:hypothetical protein [Alphaproteobacteria bacterium]